MDTTPVNSDYSDYSADYKASITALAIEEANANTLASMVTVLE